ncbi:MAG: 50S ribosomal protein L11 methyltransferase [Bacteroidaceae bacterium]|nr:50S ribosomal protein L11 methyltransferase [Bacteroidaceae bacterium]
MKYFEVTCEIRPFSQDAADVLSAMLAEIGFESFSVGEDALLAYIQQSVWNEAEMQQVVQGFCLPGVSISYAVAEAPDEDWNLVWEEEGFQPVVVSEDIVVHDVKHSDVPPATYDILITPRLAFGTGSHATTRLILRTLARLDLEGKHVIDAGTGTGILAIMAVKRGAASVFAYDIDEWSVENTKDNLLLNHLPTKDLKDLNDFKDPKVPCVVVACGDSSLLEGCEKADLLIANINRNILLQDLPRFVASLKPKGRMILSGFYLSDVPVLTEATVQHGFSLLQTESEGEWAMLLFEANALGGRDV